MRFLVSVICFFHTLSGFASLELLMRAHPTNSYKIPAGLSLNSVTPIIDSNGKVAVLANKRQLWSCHGQTCQKGVTAQAGTFFRIYSYENEKALLEVLNDDFYSEGLYYAQSDQLQDFLAPDFGLLAIQFFGNTKELSSKEVLSYVKDGLDRKFILNINENGDAKIVTREGAKTGIDYLLTPQFNESGQIVVQVILSDAVKPVKELRRYSLDGTYQVIAREGVSVDYLHINSLDLNNKGEVIFIAQQKGLEKLFYWKDGKQIELLSQEQFGRFDAFRPKINDNKQIVFRGFDKDKRSQLYYLYNKKLKKLVSWGDELETDLGVAQFGQHKASHPLFTGGITINNQGQVTFAAGLHPKNKDQVEWGTGLFRLKLPGDRLGVKDYKLGLTNCVFRRHCGKSSPSLSQSRSISKP